MDAGSQKRREKAVSGALFNGGVLIPAVCLGVGLPVLVSVRVWRLVTSVDPLGECVTLI